MLLLVGSAFAIDPSGVAPIQNYPVIGGADEAVPFAASAPDIDRVDRGTSLDSIGMALEAGKTYYDYQHNGSQGRMIYVDDNGLVHMVWMRSPTSAIATNRHVFYQVYDPATSSMRFLTGGVPTGVAADGSAPRSGYTTLAGLPQGWIYPGYHETRTGVGPASSVHAASTSDYAIGMGAWANSYPGLCNIDGGVIDIVWPHIAISRFDSTIHMVSTESPPTTGHNWQRIFYSRGHANWDGDGNGAAATWDAMDCGGFQLVDTATVIAPVVIASPYSQRVAILWSHPRDSAMYFTPEHDSASQIDNDLYVKFSEDGGLNWGPKINVTNFVPADLNCLAQAQNMDDSLACAHDSFRVYTDCNGLFDRNDQFHAAFTTTGFVRIWGRNYNRVMWFYLGQAWHWSEITHNGVTEFSPIANQYFPDSSTWSSTNYLGAWQRSIQRPCLSQDETTGYLYCSYQMFDSLHVSSAGYPGADAFVSVSRNCGRSWSQGTNITQTIAREGAAANQCKSERDITLHDKVTYIDGTGYLHMEYVYDLDNGGVIQTPAEGTFTNNPVRYHRIPVDAILPTPIVPIDDFILHADSSQMPGRLDPSFDPEAVEVCALDVPSNPNQTLRPASFKLYQNYPNPFNPTTNIQFDLVRDASVTLKVYNVLGENVATLYDGKVLSAGTKSVSFDASRLASGVYVYRLDVNGHAESLKMVLMK
jgi:hypothetical protein